MHVQCVHTDVHASKDTCVGFNTGAQWLLIFTLFIILFCSVLLEEHETCYLKGDTRIVPEK